MMWFVGPVDTVDTLFVPRVIRNWISQHNFFETAVNKELTIYINDLNADFRFRLVDNFGMKSFSRF